VLIISTPDKKEYSVLPNIRSPFHVRELFKEEFEDLIRAHFKSGHSISWLASECEFALRRHRSANMADAFSNSSLNHLSSLWRATEKTRSADALWSALAQLPQEAQEGIAAGFEYLGRRPRDWVSALNLLVSAAGPTG
jgi:hypothetical protein